MGYGPQQYTTFLHYAYSRLSLASRISCENTVQQSLSRKALLRGNRQLGCESQRRKRYVVSLARWFSPARTFNLDRVLSAFARWRAPNFDSKTFASETYSVRRVRLAIEQHPPSSLGPLLNNGFWRQPAHETVDELIEARAVQNRAAMPSCEDAPVFIRPNEQRR